MLEPSTPRCLALPPDHQLCVCYARIDHMHVQIQHAKKLCERWWLHPDAFRQMRSHMFVKPCIPTSPALIHFFLTLQQWLWSEHHTTNIPLLPTTVRSAISSCGGKPPSESSLEGVSPRPHTCTPLHASKLDGGGSSGDPEVQNPRCCSTCFLPALSSSKAVTAVQQ